MIGIAACYRFPNYGSQLQAIATQRLLDELGFANEFIQYLPAMDIHRLRQVAINAAYPRQWKEKLRHHKAARASGQHPQIEALRGQRAAAFEGFYRQFARASAPVKGYAALRQHTRQSYRAVLCGSDQVWHPGDYAKAFYTLEFAPDEMLKVAYAPSFGVTRVPLHMRGGYRRYLGRIQHVSVREIAGSRLVQQLARRPAPVVADPTLMLTAAQWAEFSGEVDVPQRYILCYFIGANPAHRQFARRLAAHTGLPLVTLPHINGVTPADLDFGDLPLYAAGPGQFVHLIKNAAYTCTDSFHGTVFSILHQTPFFTFNRFAAHEGESTNSRLDSLLRILGLAGRRFTGQEEAAAALAAEMDFAQAGQALQKLRGQSYQFLEEALAPLAAEGRANL